MTLVLGARLRIPPQFQGTHLIGLAQGEAEAWRLRCVARTRGLR